MHFKNFIKAFTILAKNEIERLERYDILGTDRKLRLDKTMTDWCNNILNSVNISLFLKWSIKTFIINNIPSITQAVFDLLKARIQGITEDKVE